MISDGILSNWLTKFKLHINFMYAPYYPEH